MFLHGELAMRKPQARHLTRFYLALSGGGAAGGLFVSAIAPVVFDGYYELPLLLIAIAIAMLVLLRRYFTANLAAYGVLSLALMATGLTLFMGWIHHHRQTQDNLAMMRNFYATSRVAEYANDRGDTVRTLYNGSIVHGTQIRSEDAARRLMPTTYYGAGSGVALAMKRFDGAPKSVGVIGLGIGTLAAYGHAGDDFRFYEINPHSQLVAERDFSYLRESAAHHEVVLGDARLRLQAEAARGRPNRFDLLVVDAFSGDSIPVLPAACQAARPDRLPRLEPVPQPGAGGRAARRRRGPAGGLPALRGRLSREDLGVGHRDRRPGVPERP
jgi:hypothetical protein